MKINQEKKQLERKHLDSFFHSLNLSYQVENSERPDFILHQSDKRIGVEHTIVLNEYELKRLGVKLLNKGILLEKKEVDVALEKKELVANKYQKRYDELWLLLIAEGAVYTNLQELKVSFENYSSKTFHKIFLHAIQNQESVQLK